ncbi:MAG: altronate dehydratase family protein [Clostridiales bacterium]|nr:altronate dehydratase family protein [Clostridiales bacterium]
MLRDVASGTEIFGVTAAEDIPRGHKMALCHIVPDENIVKYGYPIGHATRDIQAGRHIHTHNLRTSLRGLLDYEYQPEGAPEMSRKQGTFRGFVRSDGLVGIRNEIWIINTVGCVNKIAEKIARLAQARNNGRVDGIYTFVHPFGCSQLGEDHGFTQGILKNMVRHPNAGGVLVLGLGCENNNIPEFKRVLGSWDDERVKFLNAQDVDDEIEAGLSIVEELMDYAAKFTRQDVCISNLTIGLKCGGSDGFSGITANPLVGRLSDDIIAHGGTSILTEVPEMFGAESILMNRCVDEEIFGKTVDLINDFKEYFMKHDQEIYENPSPGNKEGGISTLEDKSLGCTQKGGTSPIVDVLDYGETVRKRGLNLLQGPGNDIVAVTNLMAAGAHIVLFTTGRGTPLGAPIPTVKISSNSQLAKTKPAWIDFNAGTLLEGDDMDALSQKFFDYIIGVASGEIQTLNEINDYREISIFKDGVIL